MSVERRVLVINGVERSFLCDSEDSLAEAIRNLGLTGTKIGCGAGQCGACNVILDGKLIRSCVRKMSKVKDHSSVITIEGLGTANNLHPLQLSWMVNGGVQCGFCSPGFIVSAKALLDENPKPTRSDVRDWFQKNRNACRCTGYKQLVDAVMDAAAVMRGEKTMEDLMRKAGSSDEKVFNTRHIRPAALGKVLGETDFGDDIAVKAEGAWHLAPVTSDVAHANILNIDYSEAEKAPGVRQIITAKDVKGMNRITWPVSSIFSKADGFERPILCDTKVFRYGDVIALVAADTRKQAREAAKLVKVEYELLLAYDTVLEAMAEDAQEIHPGIPNTFLYKPRYKGKDTREIFPEAAYVVEGSSSTTMQPHMPIEPESGQAFVDKDGTLTVMYKTHGVYTSKNLIAAGVGLEPDKIRIILNPAGGTFGYALSPGYAALLGVAALATNHLVTMTMSYEEHQRYTGKRPSSYTNGRLACDKDGKIIGQELHMAFDKGCYTELADMAGKAINFAGWPYNVPNILNLSSYTFTNRAFTTAYRAPLATDVFMNYEMLVDMMAEKIGMDPWDFRYKNVLREGEILPHGRKVANYNYTKLLDLAKPKYEELKKHAKENSTPEKQLGVGISIGGFTCGSVGDRAEIMLELNPDGTVTNFCTWQDVGQGGDVGALAFTHEALRPLGLTPEQIRLVLSDTGQCPNAGYSAGSRSNIMCGSATLDAADKLLKAMKKEDGTYRTYDEMVKDGIPTKYLGVYERDPNPFASGPDDVFDENIGYAVIAQEASVGVFVTEVEVDVATGKVRVLDMHVFSDIGTVVNYTSADGQAYGGMQHSIGYALSEDFRDMKKHVNLIGAGFTFIESVPDGDHYTVTYLEEPRMDDPYGAGGGAESFQSAGHISILNAVYNASGVRMTELPATPDKVKKALDDKAKGIKRKQEKYDIGDFYGILDYLKANPVYRTE
ncbi:MAG TPA: molybdopterin-dependent oxidoreductase [Clostridiaceae bacterium]|nr:molybdopterin-dependent oxidoreductase [Clostridiaceae bacterium]